MPIKVTSRVRRRARLSLAVIAASVAVAIVLAGPSAGGVAPLLQASPTSTVSGSPTASPSPSPTASVAPNPSPSPSADRLPRAVFLTASDKMVTAGAQVRLSGQVVSSDSACESQASVQIRRRPVGAPEFKLLVSVHTDSGGGFDTGFEVNRSAEYRATLFATSTCETTASENEPIFVRVKVTASPNDNPVQQGGFFTISGAVSPGHRGTNVVLERKRTRGWRKVEAMKLTRRSRYTFTLVVGWEGERTFRVRWPSQDFDHEPNTSRALTLRAV